MFHKMGFLLNRKLYNVNTQGLEQSSFCGSPGQRLLLSSGPPPSKQGEVVTPRLKGREMYGGEFLLSRALWRLSLIRTQAQLCLVLGPHSGETECCQHLLILPRCGQDRCKDHANRFVKNLFQAERAARSSLSIATAPSSSLPSSTASSPSPVPATGNMLLWLMSSVSILTRLQIWLGLREN